MLYGLARVWLTKQRLNSEYVWLGKSIALRAVGRTYYEFIRFILFNRFYFFILSSSSFSFHFVLVLLAFIVILHAMNCWEWWSCRVVTCEWSRFRIHHMHAFDEHQEESSTEFSDKKTIAMRSHSQLRMSPNDEFRCNIRIFAVQQRRRLVNRFTKFHEYVPELSMRNVAAAVVFTSFLSEKFSYRTRWKSRSRERGEKTRNVQCSKAKPSATDYPWSGQRGREMKQRIWEHMREREVTLRSTQDSPCECTEPLCT